MTTKGSEVGDSIDVAEGNLPNNTRDISEKVTEKIPPSF